MNEYDFSFNTNELTDKINKLDKGDDNLDFKITDTTGTSRNHFKYYTDVYLKNNKTSYIFNFFYTQSNQEHCKIGLVGAFNDTHKFGGYQNNSKDMQNLINIFRSKFIDRISDSL
jgi:hypothetical protein